MEEQIVSKLDLERAFYEAINHMHNFVFVEINADGVEEVIAIPKQSMDDKLEFYKKTYVFEDGKPPRHVMNKRVQIVGIWYGEARSLARAFGLYE